MATRPEFLFLPPPLPSDSAPWKEFMTRLEKYDSSQATPTEFLQQVRGTTSEHPLLPLTSLRTLLGSSKQTFLPTSSVVGVVTRKFQVRFWGNESSRGCSFSLWLRDSADLVRVTFWDAAVHMHYGKVQEGMLVLILGFKVKALYRHEKEVQLEVDKLSPVEIVISPPAGVVRSIKCTKLLAIDLHKIWNERTEEGQTSARSFLRPFLNFEFGPESLKALADNPICMDFRRSIVARIVYKSSIRPTRSSHGEVPCVWLALCDGSLRGTEAGAGRKEYVWMFLVFTFQPGLLEQLAPNQLIVVTHAVCLYLFHEDSPELLEWRLVCHSTASTQVHIVAEESDTSVWHYIREVTEKKHPMMRTHVKSMSRSFGDTPPEVSHTSLHETLFKLGRFECEYKHS